MTIGNRPPLSIPERLLLFAILVLNAAILYLAGLGVTALYHRIFPTHPQERTPTTTMVKYTDFIAEIRNGRCEAELSEALSDCARSAMENLKPATLTFSITITPKERGQVKIEDSIKANKPQAKHLPTLFFADDFGGLTRQSPNQLSLAEMTKSEGGLTLPCEKI